VKLLRAPYQEISAQVAMRADVAAPISQKETEKSFNVTNYLMGEGVSGKFCAV
jgi:hypothetical protein